MILRLAATHNGMFSEHGKHVAMCPLDYKDRVTEEDLEKMIGYQTKPPEIQFKNKPPHTKSD